MPGRIILDIDDTFDAVHGGRQTVAEQPGADPFRDHLVGTPHGEAVRDGATVPGVGFKLGGSELHR